MAARNLSAQEALFRLIAGNDRFVNDLRCIETLSSAKRRAELAENGQSPYAIVLCCSDSRVPAEHVFDAGLGELFVVRVAGNIVAPSLLGSIEFAASQFGTNLVVVMGHSSCGAIKATISNVFEESTPPSENIGNLIREIVPAVKVHATRQDQLVHISDELVSRVTRSNIYHTVDNLLTRSPILRDLREERGLMVVGAKCDIRTGTVDFFDDMLAGLDLRRRSIQQSRPGVEVNS